MYNTWLILFVIFNTFMVCSPENILIYISLPFYSHQAAYRPLWKELANRGHNLTLITLNPMEESHENITQIDLSSIYRLLEEKKFFDLLSSGEQSLSNILRFFDTMVEITDFELSQSEVKRLVDGKGHFDLVIAEFYFTLGAVFAYKYNCPMIGMVSMDGPTTIHNMLGNPTHPLLYPPAELGVSGQLSFKQRLSSIIFYLVFPRLLNSVNDNAYPVIQKHFGNNIPSMYDMQKRISILFINANPVFHTVRPLSSQTINVGGGLHIEKPKALPKDLQIFLDESEEGVIYFSLGSSIKSSNLLNRTKVIIIKTFSQLPYKILWKFEKDINDAFSLPKNVHISKWLPQQDVLRHPNIKLLITQGGLQSLEEALFAGVPVLVLPFFGDQLLNAQKVVEHGFGLSLDHRTLEVAEFKSTIVEILTSIRYKESAQRLAKQLLDRPWTGAQQAAWWTEYVLRNPDIGILKYPYPEIPFYQYFFLDVLLFCLCISVILVFFGRLLFRSVVCILSYLLGKSRKIKEQ